MGEQELHELKGLGPECEMVLNVQRQLKDPVTNQILQFSTSVNGSTPGFLYPKPAIPNPGKGQAASGSLEVNDTAQLMYAQSNPAVVEHARHMPIYEASRANVAFG